jgi:hypothetical protein
MDVAGEIELARVWNKIDIIRAKQAAKPKHSPLPEARSPAPSVCEADRGEYEGEMKQDKFGIIMFGITMIIVAYGLGILFGH